MLLTDDTYQSLWTSLAGVFSDPQVDELLINRFDAAWILQGRRQRAWSSPFANERQYLDWLLDFAGRRSVRLDPRQGAAGGYLVRSQLRWHIVLPPMAVDGPILSLRQHRFQTIGLDRFPLAAADISTLERAFQEPGLIMVAGPTGCGKTTLLSALLAAYCLTERVLILESIPELGLASTRWVRLAERGVEVDGHGGFSLSQLFAQALRLRPERLVVGEIRSHEADVLLQAMTTGHGAVLCTIHASDSAVAIRRLESLCGEGREDLSFYPVTVIMMEGQGVPRIKSVHTRIRTSSRTGRPISCRRES